MKVFSTSPAVNLHRERPRLSVNLDKESIYQIYLLDQAGTMRGPIAKDAGFDYLIFDAAVYRGVNHATAYSLPTKEPEIHYAVNRTIEDGAHIAFAAALGPRPTVTPTQVSGKVQISGEPAGRVVRAYSYESLQHSINGVAVDLSRSLGHAESDPETGDYTITIENGYTGRVFVVAFDDYGELFTPGAPVVTGQRIRPTMPNGFVYAVTSDGVLPDEEPAWSTDTNSTQLIGTATVQPTPFYRPVVHGPIYPEAAAKNYADIIKELGAYYFWDFDETEGDTVTDSVQGIELKSAGNKVFDLSVPGRLAGSTGLELIDSYFAGSNPAGDAAQDYSFVFQLMINDPGKSTATRILHLGNVEVMNFANFIRFIVNGTQYNINKPGGTYATPAWWQLAAIVSGGVLTLYIDDNKIGQATVANPGTSTKSIQLFTTRSYYPKAFEGRADSFAWFNRALTEQDVFDLYLKAING